jgi:Holliday junction resolvase-like predicted endonuclease
MEEIAKELLNTIKFIPIQERQSKWYKEYLDKVNKDLKDKLKKNPNP